MGHKLSKENDQSGVVIPAAKQHVISYMNKTGFLKKAELYQQVVKIDSKNKNKKEYYVPLNETPCLAGSLRAFRAHFRDGLT